VGCSAAESLERTREAEVTVLADLREEQRQGLFAKPASYSAVMRFSSEPGDVLSDHISTPRGLLRAIFMTCVNEVANDESLADWLINLGGSLVALGVNLTKKLLIKWKGFEFGPI
jgi:hypothetical protein